MKTACLIAVAALAMFGAGAQAQTIDDLKPPAAASEAEHDARMNEVEALLDTGQALLEQGIDADDKNRIAQAVAVIESALTVSEKYLGEGPYTALVLTNLGFAYAVAGQSDKAEAAYKRAVYIRTALSSADDIELMTTYYNLARLYVMTDRPKEAEAAYLSALRCGEQATGEDRAFVTVLLTELADLYDKLERPADAKAMRARAEAAPK